MDAMSQTIDYFLKLLSLTVIILIGVTGVYAARGLYSDGAYWLVEMLPQGGFYIFDPHRAYVQALVQAPVALALWLGVLDLNSLIRFHSFGFVGVPLVFWIGALSLQFKNRLFWLFLMAFTVSYLRSNFFAAGEFSVGYAMTAFCVSVLLRQQISYLQASLMVVTAIILTHSYEATLFLGLFLASLSVVRLVKVQSDRRSIRILILLAVLLFLISAYVGGRSALFQRAYDGKGAANLGALADIHFLYLIFVPAMLALLCTEYARRNRTMLLASIFLLVGLYLIYAFRWDQTNISYGYFSYAYRTLCCFLLLGVLSFAIAVRFFPLVVKAEPKEKTGDTYFALGVTIFFISMTGLLLYHTHGYYKWAQRFEQEAISLKTHTPIDQTQISANHGWTHGYNWGWGNPSLSILLRGNAEAMVLNHSDQHGVAPGMYENFRIGGAPSPANQLNFEVYPLGAIEKKNPLFPKRF
jgi:hypothetical protein